MRAFSPGEHFMHIPAEGSEYPVFSEAFLYDIMFKEDARFVLAIAKEYSLLIEALGEEKIEQLLKEHKHLELQVRRKINRLNERRCDKRKKSRTTASNARKLRGGKSTKKK
jgi:hypothetical protein